MALPKIKSATALRGDLYETLKEVSEGERRVITHKQGDPLVITSVNQYDKLLEEKEVLRKMAVGFYQVENGEGVSHKSAVQKIKNMKKKWK